MDNPVIGYTCGTFDLFHIGHLNLLRLARGYCDKLIVGVFDDDVVAYKGKRPVIPVEERLEIVRSIKYVDLALPHEDTDKFKVWQRLKFDVLFVGDDWFGTKSFQEWERKFAPVGVKIIYLPYTHGTSSTILTETLRKIREGDEPLQNRLRVFCE